jgi:hypothetical protein
LDQVERRIWE